MNKKEIPVRKIAFISLAGWVFMIMLYFVFSFFINKGSDQNQIGLRKPSDAAASNQPISSEQREDEYSQRPIIEDITIDEIRKTAQRLLSSGSFSELDDYLKNTADSFQTNIEYQEESPENYISMLRSDLALISGVTPDTSIDVLRKFGTPEALAAAMAYLPVSKKYEAYLNLSSFILPAVSTVDGSHQIVNLQESKNYQTKMAEMLQEANKNHHNNYLAMTAYTMTLFDNQYVLFLIQTIDGRWAPYLMDSVKPIEGILNVLNVKSIDDSITGTGQTIDSMISVSEPEVNEDPVPSGFIME